MIVGVFVAVAAQRTVAHRIVSAASGRTDVAMHLWHAAAAIAVAVTVAAAGWNVRLAGRCTLRQEAARRTVGVDRGYVLAPSNVINLCVFACARM